VFIHSDIRPDYGILEDKPSGIQNIASNLLWKRKQRQTKTSMTFLAQRASALRDSGRNWRVITRRVEVEVNKNSGSESQVQI